MPLGENMNITNQHRMPQKGFTLLEVMVAMVIFAVGMLGLAGIQALSLEGSHSSYSRSQAVLLAYEMVDRMKANSSAGANYISTAATAVAQPATLCDGATCGAAQMASFDLWQWKQAIQNSLLSGKGSVASATVGTITTYTISVHWDEDRTGVTGTDCPPDDANDLRCFQLITQL